VPGSCFDFLGAIVGGLVGGVIAAIIIGALCCLALAGGGAYAVNKAIHTEGHTHVINNPIYEKCGKENDNPLSYV